jgi:hypothetical protein
MDLADIALIGFNVDFNIKDRKLNLSRLVKNTFVFSLALLVISPIFKYFCNQTF